MAARVASSIPWTLGVLLVAGFRLRWTAFASAVLLALFGVAMALSFGPKEPLDYSVFSACAAALLLALRARGEGRVARTSRDKRRLVE